MKLSDIISVAFSNICIMDATSTILWLNWRYDSNPYISETLLNTEVSRVEADSTVLKVWLNEGNKE